MDEFLGKLSSYNLFVNLVPGCIFMFYLQELRCVVQILNTENSVTVFTLLCLWYVIGIVINRVGSLVIEPLYKKFNIILFASYDDYVNAEKQDNKITLLSEVNNFYRSMVALFSAIILSEITLNKFDMEIMKGNWFILIILLMCFVIFSLSYRSQTRYIKSRIEATLKSRTNFKCCLQR